MCVSAGVMADPFSVIAAALVSGYGLTGLAAFAVFSGAGLLSGALAKKKARKERARQIAAYNAGLSDRTTQFSSTDAYDRIIYGSPAPVAGNIQDNLLSGNEDQFRHVLIDLAAHECDGIEAIYCDGVDIGALDSDGWVTGGEFWEAAPSLAAAALTRLGEGLFVSETFTGSSFTLSYPALASSVGVYRADGEASIDPAYTLVGDLITCTNPADFSAQKFVRYYRNTTNARLRVSVHLSPGGVDTADAYMISVLPAKVTKAHKLSGRTLSLIHI